MANKKNNGNKKRVPQIVDLISIILCAGGTFCLTVGIICFIRQVSRTYTLPFTWVGAIALFVGLVIAIIAHAAVYAKNKKAKQEKPYNLPDGTPITEAQFFALKEQQDLFRAKKITKAEYLANKQQILSE